MLKRGHWFILGAMAAAIAIDLCLIIDGRVTRQQALIANIGLLFLLGVASALIICDLRDLYYQLKGIVEKLQTPGGYLEQEGFDQEEKPSEAFLKELDSIGHDARARMSCAVDKVPTGQT